MTSHQIIVIMRWLFVPVAATLGIITALVPSFIVNRVIHDILWSTGHHMPGKVFLGHYSIPVYGAFAAFLFVVFGTWAAPKHRSTVALILLAIGGVLAWICVGDFRSPIIQNGRIWEPIIGTCSGGVIACVMVYFRRRLRRLSRFKRI
ncbi:MAG: hypothetical protein JWR15_3612 [Prosthecobacter sp.]|nr:hypothetical protein [Prosthecobacter sp.]